MSDQALAYFSRNAAGAWHGSLTTSDSSRWLADLGNHTDDAVVAEVPRLAAHGYRFLFVGTGATEVAARARAALSGGPPACPS